MSHSITRRPPSSRLIVGFAAAALLALSGCMTQYLWNDTDPTDTSLEFLGDEPAVHPWYHEDTGVESPVLRAILTPFALAFDIATLPIQWVLFDWESSDDDEDEDDC